VSLDDISDDDDGSGGGGADDAVDEDQASRNRTKSTTGCLPRPASAPAVGPAPRGDNNEHATVASRPRHSSSGSRLAEKLLRLFHPGAGAAAAAHQRQAPASPRCRGTTTTTPGGRPGHRRFMRVVKDEHAPPPERVADNPNIICRYSQVPP